MVLMKSQGYYSGKLNEMKSRHSDDPDRERWIRETLAPWNQKTGYNGREFFNSSEIPIREIYTSRDLPADYESRYLGLPGEYPFTRGIYPNMYRGKLWTMRMFSGFGTSEDTNRRLKYLIAHGESGLSIAFDMPTLYGYDCDNSRADGEIGKCGVNISSLKDMEVLFRGIDLSKISTSMTINAPSAILTAMYVAIAKKQKVPMDSDSRQ